MKKTTDELYARMHYDFYDCERIETYTEIKEDAQHYRIDFEYAGFSFGFFIYYENGRFDHHIISIGHYNYEQLPVYVVLTIYQKYKKFKQYIYELPAYRLKCIAGLVEEYENPFFQFVERIAKEKN